MNYHHMNELKYYRMLISNLKAPYKPQIQRCFLIFQKFLHPVLY